MKMTEKTRKNIWKIYIFRFCISLHFIGGVLVPFFTDWGGISFTEIMFLQAWFVFWIFILEMPTGSVADYLGRKYSLLLGASVHIIAIFIYSSVPIFWIFMVGEFMWALAEALISGAGHALIYDSLKVTDETAKSKQVFGRFESSALIGYMVSAPIGSLIIFPFLGLRATMILMSIPFAIGVVIAFSFKEPKIKPEGEQKRQSYLTILKKGFRIFIKSRILIILAIEMISIGTLAFMLIWLYQPMLSQAGVDLALFGTIHAAWVGCELVVMNSYERLERLLGSKKRYLLFSALITSIMLILGGIFLAILIMPLIIMSIILIAAFGLSRTPLLINYMNKHIPSPERATVNSTINMFQMLAFVVALLLIGFGEPWSLVWTLIILGIIGVVFSLISRVKEEHLID